MVETVPFGETRFRHAAQPIGQSTPSPPTYNAKWQKVFDRIALEEAFRSLRKQPGTRHDAGEHRRSGLGLCSIPGFLLGPFYYFYLGMWRKGLWLLTLAPAIVALMYVDPWASPLKYTIPVLCSYLAKRDYYSFCIKRERIWKVLRWSKNIWTDLLLIGTILCTLGFSVNTATKYDLIYTYTVAPPGTLEVTKLAGSLVSPKSMNDQFIIIESKKENLDVYALRVSKNACQSKTMVSRRLQAEEAVFVRLACNPLEADVTTSAGTVTYTWDK